MKGGQKTIGVIWKEAIALMKAKYWQLVGISGALVATAFVLSMVVSAVFFILYAFMIPVSMILGFMPFSFLPKEPYGASSGDYSALIGSMFVGMLVSLLIFMVFYFVIMIAMIAISIVEQTVEVSMNEAMLLLVKGDKPSFNAVFASFKKNWKRYLGVAAWSMLWTMLWSMLLYVPGIIKSCSYSMAPYLVVQYPDMTVRQALRKSMEITDGYKGRLFVIILILLGFTFASELVSCCFFLMLYAAMLFWTYPLYFSMMTIAYLDIKRAAIEKGLLPMGSPAPTQAATATDSTPQQ